MKINSFFYKLLDGFLTNEAFWHHEVSDLQKAFPFLYNYSNQDLDVNSKKKYDLLYPEVKKSQNNAYNFLKNSLNFKKNDYNMALKSAKILDTTNNTKDNSSNSYKSASSISSNLSTGAASGKLHLYIKSIDRILSDMKDNHSCFINGSIARRREFLTKWNIEIAKMQIDAKATEVTLSGITLLTEDTILQLKKLKNLTALSILDSQILFIPESIESIFRIKSLRVIGSSLTYIPPHIFELQKLEELVLTDNNLKYIPEAIAKFPELKVLDLLGNHIRFLPKSQRFAKLLQKLGLTVEKILASQNINKTDGEIQTIGSYWASKLMQQNINNMSKG